MEVKPEQCEQKPLFLSNSGGDTGANLSVGEDNAKLFLLFIGYRAADFRKKIKEQLLGDAFFRGSDSETPIG
ncbi:hypothetical protein [Sulfitobacter sp.]|uniref:hypothetical protein n=1 Tax=Sulfitobacter sp. TaxID=1903071 RepID=UPI003002008F